MTRRRGKRCRQLRLLLAPRAQFREAANGLDGFEIFFTCPSLPPRSYRFLGNCETRRLLDGLDAQD